MEKDEQIKEIARKICKLVIKIPALQGKNLRRKKLQRRKRELTSGSFDVNI